MLFVFWPWAFLLILKRIQWTSRFVCELSDSECCEQINPQSRFDSLLLPSSFCKVCTFVCFVTRKEENPNGGRSGALNRTSELLWWCSGRPSVCWDSGITCETIRLWVNQDKSCQLKENKPFMVKNFPTLPLTWPWCHWSPSLWTHHHHETRRGFWSSCRVVAPGGCTQQLRTATSQIGQITFWNSFCGIPLPRFLWQFACFVLVKSREKRLVLFEFHMSSGSTGSVGRKTNPMHRNFELLSGLLGLANRTTPLFQSVSLCTTKICILSFAERNGSNLVPSTVQVQRFNEHTRKNENVLFDVQERKLLHLCMRTNDCLTDKLNGFWQWKCPGTFLTSWVCSMQAGECSRTQTTDMHSDATSPIQTKRVQRLVKWDACQIYAPEASFLTTGNSRHWVEGRTSARGRELWSCCSPAAPFRTRTESLPERDVETPRTHAASNETRYTIFLWRNWRKFTGNLTTGFASW